jgi:protein SCO1/2
MSKKVIFLIVFFLILVTGFYVAMSKLIPGFSSSKLPPISYVQPFAFRDQDGKLFTSKDVAGKVYVAEFFFTTCRGICPKLNNNMKKVYERFKNENDFLILSHTCDPATDSVARLKAYADSLGVSSAHWLFLTGRKDSLYNQARLSYTIDDPKNNLRNIDDDFLHTQFFALVDRQGRVRKIVDGLKPSEVDDMMNDVERLLKEK